MSRRRPHGCDVAGRVGRQVSELIDRVALITGASGGIGRVLARRYARSGAKVALVARRSDELNVTAAAIADEGGEALALVADIRDEDQCRDVIAATVSRWGRLDVLVNNAAVPGSDQSVADATVDNWNDVLATNLVAPMVLSREALRQAMIPAKAGNIQFLSSAAARNVQPLKAHYAAAKLGLTALGQTLALEVGTIGHPGQHAGDRRCGRRALRQLRGQAGKGGRHQPRRRAAQTGRTQQVGPAGAARRGRRSLDLVGL